MRKISLDKLDLLFSEIAKSAKLYLPVDTDNGAKYDVWEDGKKLSDALNTVRSAKDFFFPQTENLMDFKMSGKNIEIIDTRSECEDFVVFGVRACDVKSFEILDRVFLADPVDTFYKNRREHGVIISMACNKPAETCFCKTFGIDASEPCGDIATWKTDDALFLDAKTEKGEKLLSALEKITEAAKDADAEPQKALIKERLARLPLAELETSAFGNGKTNELFNAPEWKDLSESCLGCGTCTFVCPTCQCYDIKDFNTGNGVKRFRCWDSCMYSEFTRMAHGNNRLSQLERFRQRFMHKLVYYPTNNDGLFSCVGCGRCINKCPINMNIVKVMKKLGGKKNG
ncbi:MAG: 4Fe-4S dicluster domain-containing protein [Oscillospiraceae bacterium]|nr:4Fe-4S dicluster domain-containing protein [Oscillospiraceae bacterium]